MHKELKTPIRYIKGIGPKRAEIFAKMGVSTIEDLLYFFPKRYEDRTYFTPVSKIKEGQAVTIKVQVLARSSRQSFYKKSFSITEIAVGDDTGKIYCVWFNRPYLKEYFKVGSKLILYGKADRYNSRLQLSSPEFEFIEQQEHDDSLNVGRIVPVYSLGQGLSQRTMRSTVRGALDGVLPEISDFVPYPIRSKNNLLNLAKALINIHFPESEESRKESFRRLSFEEFLLFQLPIIMRKLKKRGDRGIAHKVEGRIADDFIKSLPFDLTDAQVKVINEIKKDMSSVSVMQRLLQGDVGSGKTIVAVVAALCAIQGGYQVVFMVPTEILARQHYEKVSKQFSALDNQIRPKVALLVGSSPDKKDLLSEIEAGRFDLVIGTHALLEEGVVFKNLGLTIIDEQHKFGVGQRALLLRKGGKQDVLIMTATPIPRTLAITLYGDLDISVIDQMPKGRIPVNTEHISLEERAKAYSKAREYIKSASQVYIVYPVIEDSYALDIQGAKQMYQDLKSSEFKDYRVGLIHGRMKQVEQDKVMNSFRNGNLDVLISTTVLEVGIDVPSANCMIIEHAERFGLAQLHQLRGRVGRGGKSSSCILITDAPTQEAKSRMKAMVEYSDGFRIAEQDLKIRGPGEFFGERQHGLAELKIGNPLIQMQLLKKARDEAIKLLEEDPQLKEHSNILLKQRLLERFPGYEKFINIG